VNWGVSGLGPRGVHGSVQIRHDTGRRTGPSATSAGRAVAHALDNLVVFAVGSNELAIYVAATQPKSAVALSVLVKNLHAIQAQLKKSGVAFEGPNPERPGLVGIKIQDPNGNTVTFLHADDSR